MLSERVGWHGSARIAGRRTASTALPWQRHSAVAMFRAGGQSMGDMLEFGLFVAILSMAGFAWRGFGAWMRRLESRSADSGATEALEQRLAELEEWHDARAEEYERRIAELEERLDFTERMLGSERRAHLPPADQ